jgi:hypothetical protein
LTWDTIKTQGEPHYHTKGTQPIDLYRDIQPHPSLSALDVFSLCCIIKYATRMLTQGLNEKDLFDIGNYARIVEEARQTILDNIPR